MSTRIERVNEQIRRQTSLIIQKDISNPHVSTLTTISRVETSADLKYTKIYVSVMGSEAQRNETIKALQCSAGYIQHLISKRVIMKYTPVITFVLDNSLDYSFHIDEVLKKIKEEKPPSDKD